MTEVNLIKVHCEHIRKCYNEIPLYSSYMLTKNVFKKESGKTPNSGARQHGFQCLLLPGDKMNFCRSFTLFVKCLATRV
jgi:hypothetical protein